MFRLNQYNFLLRSLFWKKTFSNYSGTNTNEIFYPVVNCQMKCSHIYPSLYVNKKSLFKLEEKEKKFPMANTYNVKKFLVDQLKGDQTDLIKIKEVVFIGRSNVGKSSLINALFDKKIARESKTPGRTSGLYFYGLEKKMGNVVDGPGYGYTEARLKISVKWRNTLYDYLRVSTRLCKIYLLINAEHGIKIADLRFLKTIQHLNVKIQIVLTKMDKIKEGQLFNKCLAIGHQLMKFQNVEYIVHAASSKTGFGIDHLKYSIIEAFLRYPTRDLKGKEESLIKHLLENKTLRPKRKKPAIMQKSGRIRKIRSQKPAELVGNENK